MEMVWKSGRFLGTVSSAGLRRIRRLAGRLASVGYGYAAWLSRVWGARNPQRRLQRAVVHHTRVLLPLASVQRIAARLGGAASPLLEEEEDSLFPDRQADILHAP